MKLPKAHQASAEAASLRAAEEDGSPSDGRPSETLVQVPVAAADSPPVSREYWDWRFSGDWVSRGGREQSRDFMRLLIRYLPAQVYEEIADHGLSLLDCGCALGDGTAVLAEEFPRSVVGGFDFSSVAIGAARREYPRLELTVADLADPRREADVLIVSHCLEHLTAPVAALSALLQSARRYVLVLVPYLESYPPHHEHLRIVHAGTFPEALEGWAVTHRAMMPPTPAWNGEQLLLVYAPGTGSASSSLTPLPTATELHASRRLLQLERLVEAASAQGIATEVAPRLAALAAAVGTLELQEPLDRLATSLAEVRAELSSLCASHQIAQQRQSVLESRVEELRDRAPEPALLARLGDIAAEAMARDASRERALEDRVAALEAEIRRGHTHVEEIERKTTAAVSALSAQAAELEGDRARLEQVAGTSQAALADARRELETIRASRLWRIGHQYWSLRRRLGLSGRQVEPAVTSAASAAVAVHEPAGLVMEEPAAPRAAKPALPQFVRPLPLQRFDVVVFSIIDWDFRFQRPQQLATQFGRHGHRVLYLSTTQFPAARRARLGADAQGRNGGRAASSARARARHLRRPARRRRISTRSWSAFETLAADLAMGDAVCLVQIPFWAPLAERLRERLGWRVVYDCMDEWTNFPGFGEPTCSRSRRAWCGGRPDGRLAPTG